MNFIIDRLYEAVEKKGNVCVGLDTCADYVPLLERRRFQNDAQAVLEFNKALIDAVFEEAACFKVQIAYYEEMGIEGLRSYSQTLKYIRSKNGIAIADIKRGDIADTAFRYANAHFSGDFEADFVTLNPYLGMDSIEPWLKASQERNKGAFVLLKTSNPGRNDFQEQEIIAGGKLYNAVGEKLSALAGLYTGKKGYGMFGAVAGCADKAQAAEIRKLYPCLFFLIPGYGAQGGGAEEAASFLKNGNGGVVNASRSIIRAWQKENLPQADNSYAAAAAFNAVKKMKDDIRNAKNGSSQRQ